MGRERVDKVSDPSEVCVAPEGEVELPSHDFGLRVELPNERSLDFRNGDLTRLHPREQCFNGMRSNGRSLRGH